MKHRNNYWRIRECTQNKKRLFQKIKGKSYTFLGGARLHLRLLRAATPVRLHLHNLGQRRCALSLPGALLEREECGAGDCAEIQRVVGVVQDQEAGRRGHGWGGKGECSSSRDGEMENRRFQAEAGGRRTRRREATREDGGGGINDRGSGHPNLELGGFFFLVRASRPLNQILF
jgi:hypothetical protein